MVGGVSQDMTHVGLGIKTVEFRTFGGAVDGSSAFTARIRSGKHGILSAQDHDTQRTLCRIVIDFNHPTVHVRE